MESLLNKVLKILREHVNQNNDEIRINQDDINRLLSESSSGSVKDELDYKYLLNKDLLDENADLISFQLSISEFIEKYGHIFPSIDDPSDFNDFSDIDGESENDSIFLQTVKGKIKFDVNHPHFHSTRFFNRLLKYYEEVENYEMCELLLKMNKSHS
jgi:hypothetical protein